MDGFFAIAYAMSDTMKDDTVLGTLALSLGMCVHVHQHERINVTLYIHAGRNHDSKSMTPF